MLNIQERIDRVLEKYCLVEASDPQKRFDFAQPEPAGPRVRRDYSGQTSTPGQWQSPNPASQSPPTVERIPITNEQMAERIANDVLSEIRPQLHDRTEKLRQMIFQLRPDLGQMVSQSWDKFKDFWHRWSGGVKEDFEAYRLLSNTITKIYEQDQPAPPQGSENPQGHDYNVARRAQFPRPGYEGPGWQPSPYSVHDTLAVFLKEIEGLFYESIKKNVLKELNKRPSASTHAYNQNVVNATKQRIRNQIDLIKVRHGELQNRLMRQQQELQKRINYEKELRARIKQHSDQTGDKPIIPDDELAQGCPGCAKEDDIKKSMSDTEKMLKQLEDQEIENLENIFGDMHLDDVKPPPPIA